MDMGGGWSTSVVGWWVEHLDVRDDDQQRRQRQDTPRLVPPRASTAALLHLPHCLLPRLLLFVSTPCSRCSSASAAYNPRWFAFLLYLSTLVVHVTDLRVARFDTLTTASHAQSQPHALPRVRIGLLEKCVEERERDLIFSLLLSSDAWMQNASHIALSHWRGNLRGTVPVVSHEAFLH
jgi:hypothetical protein